MLTIDHDLLLAELDRIGVQGNTLCWLESYITDRTQCVNVDGHLSCNIQLRHGVPQGSVLGPLLFSIYCAGLSEVFSKHGIRYHVYAEDTQLYVDFPHNDAASAADRISRCAIDVKVWLASRYLLLHETKTEAVLFSVPNNRVPQPPSLLIDICGCNVSTSANICDLGVQLDSTMSMAAHVSRTCRTAYAQLRGIARIRSSLPLRACKTLVHVLSTSETRPCTALPEPCCIDLRWSSDPLRVSSSAYIDVTNTAWRWHYESCTGCLWRNEFSLNCWPWCTAPCMQTLHVTLLTVYLPMFPVAVFVQLTNLSLLFLG